MVRRRRLLRVAFPQRLARNIGYPRKRSGNGLRAAPPRGWPSPGAMSRRHPVLATRTAGRLDRSRSDDRSRMPTVYLRCARTFMSGAAIGSQLATMRSRLSGIRGDRKRAAEKHREEAPGGITSRSHDVRPVPAFHRNLNTQTMVFVWPATPFATHNTERLPLPLQRQIDGIRMCLTCHHEVT